MLQRKWLPDGKFKKADSPFLKESIYDKEIMAEI